MFEVIGREFALRLMEDLAVTELLIIGEIVNKLDALYVHREPFKPVCQFGRDRIAIEAADLLEIGELGDFHAVAPDFPSEPRGAERRALPIVFDETNVMMQRVDPDGANTIEINVLHVLWCGLQDNLELIIMLEPVRVLAISAVLGPPRRLNIGSAPGTGSKRSQSGCRMKRSRAHFDVIGLKDHATLPGPE